jgi:SAM-dependent methyltransferase
VSEAEVEIVSARRTIEFPDEWYGLSSESHFWFEWRLRSALRSVSKIGLPRQAALRALDVGGGTGVLRGQMEAATGWTIDLTDLNFPALAAAARGRGRTLYYDVREQRPGFREAYDVVLLFDVLEHLDDRRPFLEAVLAHLRPGGFLLLNVPALRALYGTYDRAAGHFLRYERRSLLAEFVGTGLEVLDLSYWGFTMVPLLALRKVIQRGQAPSESVIRTGFKPPGAFSQAVLKGLMRVEGAFPNPPVGSSLFLAGVKRG